MEKKKLQNINGVLRQIQPRFHRDGAVIAENHSQEKLAANLQERGDLTLQEAHSRLYKEFENHDAVR
jgi:hypothetical protein